MAASEISLGWPGGESPTVSSSIQLFRLDWPVFNIRDRRSFTHFHDTHTMQTNLAATTAARKERLIALRRRKQAGEDGSAESCVKLLLSRSPRPGRSCSRSHFTFKQRNFDPETRQLRNRERGEDGDDTVEKAVQGLAESILKEDEEKRKEELVSAKLRWGLPYGSIRPELRSVGC